MIDNGIGVVMRITGDRELVANLKALETNMQRKILKPAFRAGAQVVARDARRRAPKRTGYLKKAIKPISTRFDASAGVVMNRKIANAAEMRSVAQTRGARRRPYRPAFIAHIVEAGAKLKWKTRAGSATVPAQPFLVPALEAKREQALSKIADEIRRRFK